MPSFWCGGADTWNAKTFPYWELTKRQNLLLLLNFKNYTMYFSNTRTKGWALVIFCKTKPLHVYLNRPHFTKWDEHIGISGGKIHLAAFRCSWGQSLKVELPGECSSLLSHVSVWCPAGGDQACCLRSVHSAVLVTWQTNASGNISFPSLCTRFKHQFILIKNHFTVVFFLFA